MSFPSQKPTGVFVRLPLSTNDIKRMDRAMSRSLVAHANPTLESASEAAMLAIGVPVQGRELEVVAYDNIATGYLSRAKPVTPSVNLVRQSDAQAHIAALEVEVVRLREDMDASKRKNFNAGYLIACCNIYNLHNEEGIAADILREAGITEAEVKALDLNEYDAEALAVIRGAGNDDPILKGGAA